MGEPNYRYEALMLAAQVFGQHFSADQLLEVAKQFEEYMKGPTLDASQS